MRQICHISYDSARAHENMALDATMLEFGNSMEQVMWRVYGWTEPAMTFGYSQQWEQVCSALPDFEGALVRRMTGGGIVDHRKDLTYALSLPKIHAFHRKPASDLYRELHEKIAGLLMKSGQEAGLAPCHRNCDSPDQPRIGNFCFTDPEPFDVVNPVSGTKLAGAAMKRNQSGVLIQGSIDPVALSRLPKNDFIMEFGHILADWLGLEEVSFTGTLPADILGRELERYRSTDWNQRR